MPFDLERFERAQRGGQFEAALAELRAGRKRSHWIWYVFPQIAGLGSSPMAVRYAIEGPEEARAYLRDPVLSSRLAAAVSAVHEQLCDHGTRIGMLMGSRIDAQKLVSSMTLFEHAARTLDAGEPSPGVAPLADMAAAILGAAAAQGYPRCAFTDARL